MTQWLKRLCDYWKDKCGLKVKDICEHESEWQRFYKLVGAKGDCFRCEKCGVFYR